MLPLSPGPEVLPHAASNSKGTSLQRPTSTRRYQTSYPPHNCAIRKANRQASQITLDGLCTRT